VLAQIDGSIDREAIARLAPVRQATEFAELWAAANGALVTCDSAEASTGQFWQRVARTDRAA
jgi:hypothetical protein